MHTENTSPPLQAAHPATHPIKRNIKILKHLHLEQIQTIAFDGGNAVDTEKFLSGGRLFDLGPAGVAYTRNLTPDKATGIGDWTDEEVKIAVKTGMSRNGETLFPVMPYHVYNGMADSDLDAVVAFLRSVNAISNKVPKDTVKTEGSADTSLYQGDNRTRSL